jgi:two-component system phosphate regulon sensor histidine kinase PhoR
LFLQLRNLLLLYHWLRFRRIQEVPDMGGPWGDVIAVIARLYRRKQYHKQRVVALLREFRRLTNGMPDGAVLLTMSNELIWFNQKAADLLGLMRKRDIGIRIENFVRNPDFVGYIERSEPNTSVTFRHAASDRWLSSHLIQSQGTQRRLLIVRDVTREVQLEAMRKDFVANASHELRSPLTVIAGYLDALTDEPGLDPGWQTPIDEMRRQSERMRYIIDELLELSKLESSQPLQQEQRVDVGGLLTLLRKEVLSLEHHPKDISLSLETDACLRGSEMELQSVFSNLLSNAVKYTPETGAIEMRWWVDADGAHVSVRDTGIGIAAEHLPRLTERFYRVDAGRARKQGGAGLGLAIVKHALQRHDATLTIESREGEGSTFSCHFPKSRLILKETGAGAAARR